ncbi:hypothetical protein SARC_07671 [Sphaeroforma arctica JP610]|uniref:Uncharacterized protein n=1 Tax=Sphaeroforma arctica JP610 TaxID=667725 RepID=A0A0L0FT31_9EUKA|nr:hypothetical protein SARC_07671 [Sphaeroforma arctica JP610]KNC79955.1 hypothetical protein SARC_07671 [Sphaeroforma arctica JP610]|eukprot:XP_014153857.1 hypothetical protein SARC_07671 [Sphaeroforma arctica JP610]
MGTYERSSVGLCGYHGDGCGVKSHEAQPNCDSIATAYDREHFGDWTWRAFVLGNPYSTSRGEAPGLGGCDDAEFVGNEPFANGVVYMRTSSRFRKGAMQVDVGRCSYEKAVWQYFVFCCKKYRPYRAVLLLLAVGFIPPFSVLITAEIYTDLQHPDRDLEIGLKVTLLLMLGVVTMAVKFHVQLTLPVSRAQAHLRNALMTKRLRLGTSSATTTCACPDAVSNVHECTRPTSNTCGSTNLSTLAHGLEREHRLVLQWPSARFGVLLGEADVVVTQLWATPLKLCIEVGTGVLGSIVVIAVVLSADNGTNAVVAGSLLYAVALVSAVLPILCRKVRLKTLMKYYEERRKREQAYQSMANFALEHTTQPGLKQHVFTPAGTTPASQPSGPSPSASIATSKGSGCRRTVTQLSQSDSRDRHIWRRSMHDRDSVVRVSYSEPHLYSPTPSVTLTGAPGSAVDYTSEPIRTHASEPYLGKDVPKEMRSYSQQPMWSQEYYELMLDTHKAIMLSSVSNRRMTMLNVAWALSGRLFLYFCYLVLVVVLIVVFDRVNLNVGSAVALTGLSILLLTYANNMLDVFQQMPLGYSILLDIAEVFNTPIASDCDVGQTDLPVNATAVPSVVQRVYSNAGN